MYFDSKQEILDCIEKFYPTKKECDMSNVNKPIIEIKRKSVSKDIRQCKDVKNGEYGYWIMKIHQGSVLDNSWSYLNSS